MYSMNVLYNTRSKGKLVVLIPPMNASEVSELEARPFLIRIRIELFYRYLYITTVFSTTKLEIILGKCLLTTG